MLYYAFDLEADLAFHFPTLPFPLQLSLLFYFFLIKNVKMSLGYDFLLELEIVGGKQRY